MPSFAKKSVVAIALIAAIAATAIWYSNKTEYDKLAAYQARMDHGKAMASRCEKRHARP